MKVGAFSYSPACIIIFQEKNYKSVGREVDVQTPMYACFLYFYFEGAWHIQGGSIWTYRVARAASNTELHQEKSWYLPSPPLTVSWYDTHIGTEFTVVWQPLQTFHWPVSSKGCIFHC